MPLDSVDRRLLDVLQVDGRLSNVALAERVHLSPSPCLRRVKALEHDGVIARQLWGRRIGLLAFGIAAVALISAAGLSVQGWYVWNFTRGNWVA